MDKRTSEVETAKRLQIIADISGYLHSHQSAIVSSRVGGSMAFAQYYAIRKDSDIDLDIFVSFQQLSSINSFLSFLHADRKFRANEMWDEIDLISLDCRYEEVAINLWVLNTDSIEGIGRFQKDHLTFFTTYQPSDTKSYNIFGGGRCTLSRNTETYRDGYKSDRFTLYKGRLISENYVLNNMFLVFPIFGESYSDYIVNQMWDSFTNKYQTANKEQILSFIISNVSNRFSAAFKMKIEGEIKERLSR